MPDIVDELRCRVPPGEQGNLKPHSLSKVYFLSD